MGDKRRVRRTPVLEKIRNYPYDVYLFVNEAFASIDWDDYNRAAVVLCNIVSLVFVVLNSINYTPTATTSTLFHVDSRRLDKSSQALLSHSREVYAFVGPSGASGSLWISLTQSVLVVIYVASVAICYHLMFNSTRMYSVINSNTKPKTPSAREALLSDEPTNRLVQILASVLRFFNKDVDDDSYYNDSETTTNISEDLKLNGNKLVYEIDVWQPSQFCLILFSFVNPIGLLVAKIMVEMSVWKVGLTVLLFNFQMYYLINKFLVLINDKQILYQEMFQEYNDKFVKPKTNVLKQDVGIDATGKYGGLGQVVDHSNPYYQNTKSKVFIVHDINGKPFNTISKEDIDEERKLFESEKIRFELERDKFNHEQKVLNSSMDSDWLRNTIHSTPFKTPGNRDNYYNRSSLRSFNTSPVRDRDRSYMSSDASRMRSPGQPLDRSPTRPRSPVRSVGVGIGSPIRTGMTSPTRNGRLSPERPHITTPTYDTKTTRFNDRTPTINRWK
ncbi:Nuclear rim protein 1 [Yamadazyma tenuis]|uniref:Nuclear rim protein 1 n=1 Tax=Candida tenuis TaxID=2315449 RepID=UPI00279A569B|nr:Nuclear rim protein 1 [Yamadazyma tenuis]